MYGVVPPTVLTVADPFDPPKQDTFVFVILSVAGGVTVTTTEAVATQPAAEVPVTV